MNENPTTRPRAGTRERLDQIPKLSDALRKGVSVRVTIWGGRGLSGTVCDRDQTGLLLDLGDREDDGYAFLPWSSVEQVEIPEVAHRQVKFLQG